MKVPDVNTKPTIAVMASAKNIEKVNSLLRSAILDISPWGWSEYAWDRLYRHIQSYDPIDKDSHREVIALIDRRKFCYFKISAWVKKEIKAIREQGAQVEMPLPIADKVFLSFFSVIIFTLLVVIFMTLDINTIKNHIPPFF